MNCDFCLEDAPLVKDYHPDGKLIAHLHTGVVLIDDGDWGACVVCAALIDARQFTALTNRAVEAMVERGLITSDDVGSAVTRMQLTLQYVIGVSMA